MRAKFIKRELERLMVRGLELYDEPQPVDRIAERFERMLQEPLQDIAERYGHHSPLAPPPVNKYPDFSLEPSVGDNRDLVAVDAKTVKLSLKTRPTTSVDLGSYKTTIQDPTGQSNSTHPYAYFRGHLVVGLAYFDLRDPKTQEAVRLAHPDKRKWFGGRVGVPEFFVAERWEMAELQARGAKIKSRTFKDAVDLKKGVIFESQLEFDYKYAVAPDADKEEWEKIKASGELQDPYGGMKGGFHLLGKDADEVTNWGFSGIEYILRGEFQTGYDYLEQSYSAWGGKFTPQLKKDLLNMILSDDRLLGKNLKEEGRIEQLVQLCEILLADDTLSEKVILKILDWLSHEPYLFQIVANHPVSLESPRIKRALAKELAAVSKGSQQDSDGVVSWGKVARVIASDPAYQDIPELRQTLLQFEDHSVLAHLCRTAPSEEGARESLALLLKRDPREAERVLKAGVYPYMEHLLDNASNFDIGDKVSILTALYSGPYSSHPREELAERIGLGGEKREQPKKRGRKL